MRKSWKCQSFWRNKCWRDSEKNIPASRLGLACQAENGLRYEDDLLWLSWRGAGRNVLWPQRNGFLHLRLPQLPPPASFQTSKIPPLAHPLSPMALWLSWKGCRGNRSLAAKNGSPCMKGACKFFRSCRKLLLCVQGKGGIMQEARKHKSEGIIRWNWKER